MSIGRHFGRVASKYETLLKQGKIRPDERQARMISELDPLGTAVEASNGQWIERIKKVPDPYQSLQQSQPSEPQKKAKSSFFGAFFDSEGEQAQQAPEDERQKLVIDSSPLNDLENCKGIYMYGGPGSGKTFMMDLFYSQVEIENKRRASYTSFVLQIHKMNHQNFVNKTLDPLFKTSLDVARQYRLFCFDEVQVTEVGDAILMKRFFDAMWKLKVVLVATSNRKPEDLYKSGIQREYFLPFIDMVRENCHVINIDSVVDYRLLQYQEEAKGSLASKARNLEHPNYVYPLCKDTEQKMEEMFLWFTNGAKADDIMLQVTGHRSIRVRGHGKVCRLDFKTFFKGSFGAADFIVICSKFEIIFLEGVERINLSDSNMSKRFILFIDEAYNHKNKLFVSAEVEAQQILVMNGSETSEETFMIHRCASRLNEMKTHKYMLEKHQTDPLNYV